MRPHAHPQDTVDAVASSGLPVGKLPGQLLARL